MEAKKKDHFEQAIDWEASVAVVREKSEKRAWRVAYAMGGVMILSWAALIALLPLKERVPYLIVENASTGGVEILNSLDVQTLDYAEARDKYWIAQYINARESYNWHTLTKDYNTVGLLSSPDVGRYYANLFVGDQALDQIYKDNVEVKASVISIITSERGTATIRFKKNTRRVDDAAAGVSKTWVATIAYTYRLNDRASNEERIKNPFGFTVTSYRVDPELVGGEL